MEGRSCGFKRRHFNNENWWRAIKINVNENRFSVCESSCHLIQLSSKIASFIAVAVIIFPDPRLRASKFIFPAGFCSEINRIFVIVDAEMSHNNKHSLVLYQYQLKMTQTLPFSSCLQLHQFWSLFLACAAAIPFEFMFNILTRLVSGSSQIGFATAWMANKFELFCYWLCFLSPPEESATMRPIRSDGEKIDRKLNFVSVIRWISFNLYLNLSGFYASSMVRKDRKKIRLFIDSERF